VMLVPVMLIVIGLECGAGASTACQPKNTKGEEDHGKVANLLSTYFFADQGLVGSMSPTGDAGQWATNQKWRVQWCESQAFQR